MNQTQLPSRQRGSPGPQDFFLGSVGLMLVQVQAFSTGAVAGLWQAGGALMGGGWWADGGVVAGRGGGMATVRFRPPFVGGDLHAPHPPQPLRTARRRCPVA